MGAAAPEAPSSIFIAAIEGGELCRRWFHSIYYPLVTAVARKGYVTLGGRDPFLPSPVTLREPQDIVQLFLIPENPVASPPCLSIMHLCQSPPPPHISAQLFTLKEVVNYLLSSYGCWAII